MSTNTRPVASLLIAVSLLGSTPAQAQNADTTPCLKPSAAPAIQRLFAWRGEDLQRTGPVGDITIGRASIQVSLQAAPGCALTLSHAAAPPVGAPAALSRSFRITFSGTHRTPPCLDRFRQAAALLQARDRDQLFWSRCGRAQPRAPSGAPADARTPLARPRIPRARSPVWYLVLGGLLVMLVLGGLLSYFRDRLHNRALRVEKQLAAATRATPNTQKRLQRWGCWTPWLVLVLLVLAAWDIGFNDELVAGFNLYPYQYLAASGGEAAPAPCSNGLFRQDIRPIFGVCSDGIQRPLLFNPYSTTVVFWPFSGLARAVPPLADHGLRWFVLPVLGLLLWLFGRLLRSPTGSPALAALAPCLLLLFPISVMYTTPVLYEYVPLLLVLAAWWLLLHWNRHGSAWCAVTAAGALGLAVQQKLTFALVVLAFGVAFVVFFGLRRLRSWLLWLSVGVAGLAALFLVLVSYHYDAKFHRLLQLRSSTDGPLDSSLSFSHSLFTAVPTPGSGWAAAAYLLLLIGLLAYCVWKIRKYFQGDPESLVPAFASAMLLPLIPLLMILYRSNPTSSPLVQFMPFPVLVLAAMLLDLHRWLKPRYGPWGRRLALLLLVCVALWGLLRWRSYYQWQRAYPAHLSRQEQHRAARRLLALGARRPVVLDSYFNGVFELLTQGALRPRYLVARDFKPLEASSWQRLLRGTRGSPTDFLFSAERFAFDHVTADVAQIRRRFLEAARVTGRRIEGHWTIRTSGGGPAFYLYRLK